ncbi:translation initiation factor IF-2-like [Cervus elaphus]|uniref:translation initiation factor IF-2-like n=1 Tax=Cervus elaphus TaxID=9860 RepID=UPI001CC2E245|nr:translation initiation factor IF-2-like [Cervus elaphus]
MVPPLSIQGARPRPEPGGGPCSFPPRAAAGHPGFPAPRRHKREAIKQEKETMNQFTPEKHNASAARCLGLRSGVGCAPERALLPSPRTPGPGSPLADKARRWAGWGVSGGHWDPADARTGGLRDAAGGSRSDGRARASGRRRGARGGLRAGPRRGAGEWGIREGRGPGRGPDNGPALAGPGGGASRGRGGASRGAGTVGKFSQPQLGEALESRRALCASRTPPQILPEPRCGRVGLRLEPGDPGQLARAGPGLPFCRGAQTAEESVRFGVTPGCPTPGAEESWPQRLSTSTERSSAARCALGRQSLEKAEPGRWPQIRGLVSPRRCSKHAVSGAGGRSPAGKGGRETRRTSKRPATPSPASLQPRVPLSRPAPRGTARAPRVPLASPRGRAHSAKRCPSPLGSAGAEEAAPPRERTSYPASGPGAPGSHSAGHAVPAHGGCVHPSLGGRSGGRPDPAHSLGPSSGGRPLARLARRGRVHRTRVHGLFAPGDVRKPVPRLLEVPLSPPRSLAPVLSPTSQTQPEVSAYPSGRSWQPLGAPALGARKTAGPPATSSNPPPASPAPLRLGLEGRHARCLWKLHLALLQNKFISVSRNGVSCRVNTQRCHSHQRFPPSKCEFLSPEGAQEEG